MKNVLALDACLLRADACNFDSNGNEQVWLAELRTAPLRLKKPENRLRQNLPHLILTSRTLVGANDQRPASIENYTLQ
ncbi:hypothetical protein [Pseudomonas floridensis]|uniref:hypothetical protein n=1 Tax=Pseudomonas floridensis TaxID=1958950 RepID=UPI00142D427E|nr:hypothetical protein [Pseudomonas floridensis]